jgi:hypothetical protein
MHQPSDKMVYGAVIVNLALAFVVVRFVPWRFILGGAVAYALVMGLIIVLLNRCSRNDPK